MTTMFHVKNRNIIHISLELQLTFPRENNISSFYVDINIMIRTNALLKNQSLSSFCKVSRYINRYRIPAECLFYPTVSSFNGPPAFESLANISPIYRRFRQHFAGSNVSHKTENILGFNIYTQTKGERFPGTIRPLLCNW